MRDFLKIGQHFKCKDFAQATYHIRTPTDGTKPYVDKTRLTLSSGSGSVHTQITETKPGGWSRKVNLTLNTSTKRAYRDEVFKVTHTEIGGGGCAHGPHDRFPDGHRVFATCISDGAKIMFYQSGCFTNVVIPSSVELVERGVERLDELEAFTSKVADVLSEFGNGVGDAEIEELRDLAMELASDWKA